MEFLKKQGNFGDKKLRAYKNRGNFWKSLRIREKYGKFALNQHHFSTFTQNFRKKHPYLRKKLFFEKRVGVRIRPVFDADFGKFWEFFFGKERKRYDAGWNEWGAKRGRVAINLENIFWIIELFFENYHWNIRYFEFHRCLK